MKRSFVFTTLILSLLIFLNLSCNNSFILDKETSDFQCAKISFSVTDFDAESSSESDNSRIILPATDSVSEINKFVLTGSNSDASETISEEYTTYSDLQSASFELIPGTWTFTLKVYKTVSGVDTLFASSTLSDVTLSAYNAALNNSAALAFTMDYSVNAFTTGTLSVKINVPYQKLDHAVVNGTLSSGGTIKTFTSSELTPTDAEDNSKSYIEYNLAAAETGLYTLIFDFYTKKSSADTAEVTASRVYLLQVQGGRTTSIEITLDGDLNKKYGITYVTNVPDGETLVWARNYQTEFNSSQKITLPAVTELTTEHYTFDGWYDNAECSGTAVTEFSRGQTQAITVYGKWTKKSDGAVTGTAMSTLYDSSDTEGTVPTEGETYIISSEDDLIYLRTLVNAGHTCSGGTFKLGNAIALTSDWTPIGTSSTNVFSGTLDGNGFEISSININASSGYLGLIAYAKNAEIKNLTLSGTITGTKERIAGFVADAIGTVTIENCINNVAVTGNGNVGGIVGYAANNSGTGVCTITNCINKGAITSTSGASVAGIIGASGSGEGIVITNCGNTGAITGNTIVAGIMGTSNATSNSFVNKFLNCWSSGTLSYTSTDTTSGSIIGKMLTSTYQLNYCYYSSSASTIGTDSSGSSSQIGSNNITFTNDGSASTLSSTVYETTDLTTALNSWIQDSDGGNDSSYATYKRWYADSDGYPCFTSPSRGGASGVVAAISTLAEAPASGTYSVSTAAEIATIATWVNTNKKTLEGVTIKLSDDETISWTTIGTGTNPFKGTFDGNGKTLTVSNLSGTNNLGLFGSVENATIKDVTIVGSVNDSNSGTNVGGVVAYSKGNLLIENCTMSGYFSCSGATNVGGIVGKAEATDSTDSIIIRNCLVTMGINASSSVGGIIGCVSSSTGTVQIENCGVLGQIIGTENVGGILGVSANSATKIINCVVDNTVSYTTATNSGVLAGSITDLSTDSITYSYGYLGGGQTTLQLWGTDYSSVTTASTVAPFKVMDNITTIYYSDSTTADLKTTLNAWCTANSTASVTYKQWTEDSSGVMGFAE